METNPVFGATMFAVATIAVIVGFKAVASEPGDKATPIFLKAMSLGPQPLATLLSCA